MANLTLPTLRRCCFTYIYIYTERERDLRLARMFNVSRLIKAKNSNVKCEYGVGLRSMAKAQPCFMWECGRWYVSGMFRESLSSQHNTDGCNYGVASPSSWSKFICTPETAMTRIRKHCQAGPHLSPFKSDHIERALAGRPAPIPQGQGLVSHIFS